MKYLLSALSALVFVPLAAGQEQSQPRTRPQAQGQVQPEVYGDLEAGLRSRGTIAIETASAT